METELLIDSATTLAATTRGEIDSQISTAKAYPRDITKAKATIEELACSDPDTAATMFYAVPRGGKTVEGPSVRLAEVVAYWWQNLRFESRIVSIDAGFVTAQATVMDMERNTAGRGECKRRITNKNGKRYNDDMIQTTCNAACAVALREAVFRVVPRAIFEPVWRKAKLISVGEVKSIVATAAKAMAFFAKLGITEDRVLALLGKASLAAIDEDDLGTLKGLAQALREGSTTVEDAFPLPDDPIADEPESKPADEPVATTIDPNVQQTNADAFRNRIDYADCGTMTECNTLARELLTDLATLDVGDYQRQQLDELVNAACDRRQDEIRSKRGAGSNEN